MLCNFLQKKQLFTIMNVVIESFPKAGVQHCTSIIIPPIAVNTAHTMRIEMLRGQETDLQ